MSSVKRHRRAFAPETYEAVKKSLQTAAAEKADTGPITTAAGGAKGPAHMGKPGMKVQRTKVFGVIEQGNDGQLYMSKVKPPPEDDEADAPEADDTQEGEQKAKKSTGEVIETGVAWNCPIVKTDAGKRLVTGIVLEPETVDAQMDIYDADVIAKAAHDYLREWNAGTVVGYMHKDMSKSLDVVESYCAPVDMTIGSTEIKKGTWLMTVYVADDKVWKQVKDGEIAGFSIGGIAKVQQLDDDGEPKTA